jgi:hypothetical protein
MADGILKATFQKVYTVSANEALKPELSSFVGTQAFPFVKMDKASGIYPTFTARDFRTNEITQREPGSEYKRTKTKFGNNTYIIKDYGLEEAIDDRERETLPVDVEQVISDKFMLNGMRKLEQAVATDMFATSGGATTIRTGSSHFTKWVTSGGDPITDVWSWKRTVKGLIGIMPTHAAMGEDVFIELLNHSDIIGRLPDNQLREVQLKVLAQLFGLQDIHVFGAVTDSSNENDASASISDLVSDKFLLYYKGMGNSVGSAGFAKTLYQDASQGVTQNGIGLYKYRDEKIKSDIIRVEQYFTTLIQSPDAALLANDVI